MELVKKLKKPDLLLLCEELGIEVERGERKPQLIRAIQQCGAEDDEIEECWEVVEKRQKEAEEDKKNESRRLALQESQAANNSNNGRPAAEKMKDLMEPYKVNDDMGLFLVNFERLCESHEFLRDSWPQRLLSVLPCEAAAIIARLKKEDAGDYDKVKTALLKKYRLSADAFRRRFREAAKRSNESFQEFSYKLNADLVQWLKGENAFGNHNRVVEVICLEQFYSSLSPEMRLWVQDRIGDGDMERAAELADEFTARRESERARSKPLSQFRRDDRKQPFQSRGTETVKGEPQKGAAAETETAASGLKNDKKKERAFEAKRPIVCYRCNEPGHVSTGCRKPKAVFSFSDSSDDSLELLKPYLYELTVNGKPCQVLRDSAATMDIVHPSYVKPENFTGECAWIRQVVEENSVCLPIARVEVEGPFGLLVTEAAVSQNLPKHYPYLFSNRSDMLLRKKGLCFSDHTVLALTRSKAREIAAEMKRNEIQGEESSSDAQVECRDQCEGDEVLESRETMIAEQQESALVLPHSEGFLDLLKVDRDQIVAEQESDSSLRSLSELLEEEVETEFGYPIPPSAVPLDRVLEKITQDSDLNADQQSQLKELLWEFEECFADRPGKTSLIEHDIELTSNEPVQCRPYRVSPRQREILESELQRMLELGLIVPSDSEYASPLILVEAQGKNPRPCIDYRRLNAITRDQNYPIPNLEERVETISSAEYVSTLDLTRGYWQVPLTERASRYAAFTSPMGTFRPLVLTFGLKNAPFCFSRLMDRVLEGTQAYALPYLDDIAVFSHSWAEHLSHLRDVLGRLRAAGLTLKGEKCQLGKAEVSYLGHVVGRGYRRPPEIKVAAISEYPRPLTKTDIRSFLGLTGYYQHYIRNFSEIASPLTDSLRKNEPVRVAWNEEKEKSFVTLKQALIDKPLLRAPVYERPFILQCDASDRGMGAVLSQKSDNDEEHPVLFVSRKLTERERAYSTSEKECACLVWAVQKLQCYLAGSRFLIETDHCPLTWLRNMSAKNGRLLRWSLALQEHAFDVRYKKGRDNGNADGLSRGFPV